MFCFIDQLKESTIEVQELEGLIAINGIHLFTVFLRRSSPSPGFSTPKSHGVRQLWDLLARWSMLVTLCTILTELDPGYVVLSLVFIYFNTSGSLSELPK